MAAAATTPLDAPASGSCSIQKCVGLPARRRTWGRARRFVGGVLLAGGLQGTQESPEASVGVTLAGEVLRVLSLAAFPSECVDGAMVENHGGGPANIALFFLCRIKIRRQYNHTLRSYNKIKVNA